MIKRLGLTHLLIAFAAVILAAGIFIILQPGSQAEFDKSSASQDTNSFSEYALGRVKEVKFEQIDDAQGVQTITQQFDVEIGKEKKVVTIDNTQILDKAGSVKYKAGDKVVLGMLPSGVDAFGNQYVIVDRYRMTGIYIVVGIFVMLAVLVGRRRGLTSLLGLGITGAILLMFITPQILAGKDAFAVALVGAGAIVLVSMFISHGFSRRIQVAAISTLVALALTGLITFVFVKSLQLFGLGQSDAFLLQNGVLGSINLQGVLLAGVIISVLGILDDITTAQTAAIEELHKTDNNLSVKELYTKGLSIGREHIASLINTLILVYAGAALPLFLLLTLQHSQPLWVLLNSEFIAEELGRSLVGSITLILAVPISTFLAAYIFGKKIKNRT